jgi:hypothetical protein
LIIGIPGIPGLRSFLGVDQQPRSLKAQGKTDERDDEIQEDVSSLLVDQRLLLCSSFQSTAALCWKNKDL